MGKIQANPYGYKPDEEEEIEGEGSEDRPAFEPEDGETVVETEGEPVVAPGEGEGEGEGENGEGEGEEEKPVTFKNQEELDAYVKEHGAVPAEAKVETPAAPVAPVTGEEEDEFDKELKDLVMFKGYKDEKTGKWVGEAPADWNDFARKIIAYMSPKTYAPKILKVVENMTASQKAEMADIDKEFDVEYDGLATKGLVPKRGTKEGDEVNAKISIIGGTYGLTSMTKAYELAKKIPSAEGGLLDYKPTATKPNPSKQVSRLISSSTKTNAAGKKKGTMSYAKLHSARSVDELIDEE